MNEKEEIRSAGSQEVCETAICGDGARELCLDLLWGVLAEISADLSVRFDRRDTADAFGADEITALALAARLLSGCTGE